VHLRYDSCWGLPRCILSCRLPFVLALNMFSVYSWNNPRRVDTVLKRAIGIIRSTFPQVAVSLVAPSRDHIFAMVQTLELEPRHETTLRESFWASIIFICPVAAHTHTSSMGWCKWLLIHIHHRWDDVSGCSYTYIIDGCGGNDIPTRQMKITKRYSSEAAVRSVGLFHILELCIYRFEIRNSRRTRKCLRGRHCETQHVPVKHYCGCKYTLQSTVWYATPKAPSTIVAQVCTTPSTNTI
jgi:hypothetical protein